MKQRLDLLKCALLNKLINISIKINKNIEDLKKLNKRNND